MKKPTRKQMKEEGKQLQGWAYINLPPETQSGLEQFRLQFPAAWQTDNHGMKLPSSTTSSATTMTSSETTATTSSASSSVAVHSPLLHVTFLLKVKLTPEQLESLRQRVAQEPVLRVELGTPFFETVERIRGVHVKCVGVPLVDPSGAFIKFRQSCATLAGATVGYPDSVGHISLVYVAPAFHELAQQAC